MFYSKIQSCVCCSDYLFSQKQESLLERPVAGVFQRMYKAFEAMRALNMATLTHQLQATAGIYRDRFQAAQLQDL